MNLFGLFKSKQEKNVEKIKEEAFNKIFPGGDKQIEFEIDEISNLVVDKYSRVQLGKVYFRVVYSFFLSQDKSEETVVQGVTEMMDGKNAKEDFLKIYDYVKNKYLKQNLGIEDQAILDDLAGGIFGGSEGCDADEIPGSYGDYGFSPNNPIPTKGIAGSNVYLMKLRPIDVDQEVEWERTGTCTVDNIENVIDEYKISSTGGNVKATIYVSPYHRRNSEKAPKGFKLA